MVGKEKSRNFILPFSPPLISTKIIEKLGQNNFLAKRDIKILIEKPFGIDLKTAKNK